MPLLSDEALLKFRTRHCERLRLSGRCDFGEEHCQFSHNIEWTRRPLWKHNYQPQLCQFVRFIPGESHEKLLNTCCLHRNCPWSHSRDEQLYHPTVYKKVPCERHPSCDRYYCPFAHGSNEMTESVSPSVLRIFQASSQDELCPKSRKKFDMHAFGHHRGMHAFDHHRGMHAFGHHRGMHAHELFNNSLHEGIQAQHGEIVKTCDHEIVKTCDHEIVRISSSRETLSHLWVRLSRIAAIRHPSLAQALPLRIDIGRRGNDNDDAVLCVSVQSNLTPLENDLDLQASDRLMTSRSFLDAVAAVLNAIAALHRRNIVHGKCRPSTFLKTTRNEVVVGGFMACLDGQAARSTDVVWSPPEAIDAGTKESDIWSLGLCIFYFVTNRQNPFGDSPAEIVSNVQTNHMKNKRLLSNPLLADLVLSNMLETKAKRCSIDAAVAHPVFWSIERVGMFLQEFCHTHFAAARCCCCHVAIVPGDEIYYLVEMFAFLPSALYIPETLSRERILGAIEKQTVCGCMALGFLLSCNGCSNVALQFLTLLKCSSVLLTAWKLFNEDTKQQQPILTADFLGYAKPISVPYKMPDNDRDKMPDTDLTSRDSFSTTDSPLDIWLAEGTTPRTIGERHLLDLEGTTPVSSIGSLEPEERPSGFSVVMRDLLVWMEE